MSKSKPVEPVVPVFTKEELPSNWDLIPIAEICLPVEKVNPKERPDSEFDYIDISGVDNNLFRIAETKRYAGRQAPSRARQLVRAGDIVFSTVRTYLKNIALVRPEHDQQIASTGFCVLRPAKPEFSKYLYYYVQYEPFLNQLARFQRGTSYPAVRDGDVTAQLIPVPPKDEATRIVAEIEKQFSRLDEAVANLKRVKANLKRYKAAVLKAAVEGKLTSSDNSRWEKKLLGDVLTSIQAGKSFKCEERPPGENEVGVVKVSAVTWGTYDELESKTCLDPSRVDQRLFVKTGDFLFSRANTIDLVGACVIAGSVHKQVMLSDKILRLRFTDAVLPEWVLFWLRAKSGRSEIRRLSTGNQESMRNIGQDRIRQIRIEVPPLSDQRRIVTETERRLSINEELMNEVAANLKRVVRLRESILRKAFNAQLLHTVRFASPEDSLRTSAIV